MPVSQRRFTNDQQRQHQQQPVPQLERRCRQGTTTRHLRHLLTCNRLPPARHDRVIQRFELRFTRIDIDGNPALALWSIDLVNAGFIQVYELRPGGTRQRQDGIALRVHDLAGRAPDQGQPTAASGRPR